jgi:hypothetical protein
VTNINFDNIKYMILIIFYAYMCVQKIKKPINLAFFFLLGVSRLRATRYFVTVYVIIYHSKYVDQLNWISPRIHVDK